MIFMEYIQGEINFIRVDPNNRYIKFGKIDENSLIDYREDKNVNKVFQQILNYDDHCDISNYDDNDYYYNIKII